MPLGCCLMICSTDVKPPKYQVLFARAGSTEKIRRPFTWKAQNRIRPLRTEISLLFSTSHEAHKSLSDGISQLVHNGSCVAAVCRLRHLVSTVRGPVNSICRPFASGRDYSRRLPPWEFPSLLRPLMTTDPIIAKMSSLSPPLSLSLSLIAKVSSLSPPPRHRCEMSSLPPPPSPPRLSF